MTVTDVNSGGLLATLESLPAFVPYSLMDKSQDGTWMSIEVSAQDYRTHQGRCFLCKVIRDSPQSPHQVFSVIRFLE